MSLLVTFNGSTYIIPETNEVGWGSNLDSYLVAIAAGALQKTGGSFTLSAELDFGASFGIESLYYRSRAVHPALSGILRMGNTEGVKWRNAGDTADLDLSVNALNELVFNGVPIAGTGTFTPLRAVVTDAIGSLVSSATTSTEISYVNGVTSSIQTQLNNKLSLSGGTLTGALSLAPGSAALPSLNFSDETTSGLFSVGSNQVGVTSNGVEQFRVGNGVLEFRNTTVSQSVNGTVSLPSMAFAQEPSSGRYRIGSGQYGDSVGGVLKNYLSTSRFISYNKLTVGMDAITGSTFTPTTGGTLATNTYYYKIYAFDGQNFIGAPSPEAVVVVSGSNHTVQISWTAVSQATYYRIQRGTLQGSGDGYFQTASTSLNDSGQAFTAAGNAIDAAQNANSIVTSGTVDLYASQGAIRWFNYTNNTIGGSISCTSAGEMEFFTSDGIVAGMYLFGKPGDGHPVIIDLRFATPIINFNASQGDIKCGGITGLTFFPTGAVQGIQAPNRLGISDGTAASPSLYFSSQTNFGWYKSLSSVISLSIAGAEEYRFSTSDLRPETTSKSLGALSAPWTTLFVSSQILNSATSNQIILGTTNTVTINSPAPAASRTYTIPDAGGAANFLLSGWGQIVNADINAAASIAYSKLNLANSIVNADVNTAAAIVYSKLNLSNGIVNADINTSAAIALSKLAPLTTSRALQSNSSTGFIEVSAVTNTELGYSSGVTSAIQTQLGTKIDTAGTGLSKTGTTLNISTVPVANGGTSVNSFTTYALIAGGTTSTGALQSLASVGASGQVLTSNGAGALPTFQNVSGTGTVNSGTQYQLAFYATSTNAVSGTSHITTDASGILTADLVIQSGNGSISSPTFSFINDSNSGMYNKAGDNLGFATNGVLRFDISTTALTSTLPFLGQNGTAAAPSVSFSGDSDTGMYDVGANDLGFATNGVLRFDISTTALTSTLPFLGANGTAGAPSHSFASDTDTGMYRTSANEILFATNGVLSFGIETNCIQILDGTVSVPGITFISDSDTGLYRIGANSMGVAANGANVATFASTGVSIKGTTTNDSAASGFVGEVVTSSASFTNFPTSGQYGDLASISLTAGDWLVSVQISQIQNGATVSTVTAGVSSTSGNSGSGLTDGDTQNSCVPQNAASGAAFVGVMSKHVQLSGTTTYYLKYTSSYTIATPQAAGRITAVRIR